MAQRCCWTGFAKTSTWAAGMTPWAVRYSRGSGLKGEAADAQQDDTGGGGIDWWARNQLPHRALSCWRMRARLLTDREKTNIELALAEGYSQLEEYPKLLAVGSDLVKEVPESRLAFMTAVEGLIGLKRYDEALALADARLKLLDNDADAFQAKVRIEASRGNYVRHEDGFRS